MFISSTREVRNGDFVQGGSGYALLPCTALLVEIVLICKQELCLIMGYVQGGIEEVSRIACGPVVFQKGRLGSVRSISVLSLPPPPHLTRPPGHRKKNGSRIKLVKSHAKLAS